MTITAIVTRTNGVNPTEVKRVPAGTKGARKIDVWTGEKYRAPKMGETVDVFVDGSTPYAIVPRD